MRRCFAAKLAEAGRRSADARREAAEAQSGNDVSPDVAEQFAATLGQAMKMFAREAQGNHDTHASTAPPNGARTTVNDVD